MSHKALVSRVDAIRPIPERDRIQLASVGGSQVIVGIDVQVGDVGLFFDSELCLSPEFAEANNLVRKKDPVTGVTSGGYFEENRRVRAMKMGGVKSEGFWCPLELLAFTKGDLSTLKVGDQIDEAFGVPICTKYITPATHRARANQPKARKNDEVLRKLFREHQETEQLRRNAHLIPSGALVTISVKIHGTSGRRMHAFEEVPAKLNWLQALYYKIRRLPTPTTRVWNHYDGSRRVILQKRVGTGFYGEEGFRQAAVNGVNLHKSECLFFEIAGFTETGAPIMARQGTAALKDKRFVKMFGPEVTYAYGMPEGKCDLWVYRITQVNEDGVEVELPFWAVQKRCTELGLKTVPVLEQFIYDGNTEALLEKVERLVEGEDGVVPSRIDNRHPEEGIVLRSDSIHGTQYFKHKSFLFGLLEGYQKEQDVVDLEEAS